MFAAELDRGAAGRDPDQRCDRAVLVAFAEERASSSAYARSYALSSQSKPPHISAVLISSGSSTLPKSASCSSARGPACAREDRGRGLAAELVHRKLRVGSSSERVRARLDERFDERPVLVERRPVVGAVLLEGERQVGAALQLLEQRTERAEAKSPKTVEELRSAHDHNCAYAVFGSSPFWHSGHQ